MECTLRTLLDCSLVELGFGIMAFGLFVAVPLGVFLYIKIGRDLL